VLITLSQTGPAGAVLLGQTQAAAINGTAVFRKATLRAKPGEYQLIVTALNAPLVRTHGSCCCSFPVGAGYMRNTVVAMYRRPTAPGQKMLGPTLYAQDRPKHC
jgi:hypothetical protein